MKEVRKCVLEIFARGTDSHMTKAPKIGRHEADAHFAYWTELL